MERLDGARAFLDQFLRGHGAQVRDVPATRVTLQVGDRVLLADGQPAPPEAAALAAWLWDVVPEGLAAFDRLPPEAPAGGRVLTVALPHGRLTWERSCADEAWSEADRAAAIGLRTAWLEAALRQAEEEMAAQQARESLLIAELDHRLRNILANVQALVRLSRRGAASVEAFAGDLEERLHALALAHGLFRRSRVHGARLRDLVAETLRPHRKPGSVPRVTSHGPDIALRPEAAVALALVLHELATNAAKHGALSVPDGRLRLHWRRQPDGLILTWRESGGPPVHPPARRGFGLSVIQRSFALGLGGTSQLDFAPAGLRCTIRLPAAQVAEAG